MPPAETTARERIVEAGKDTRFKPGNPGRPKGSKNKLCEDFLGDMLTAWEARGPAAINAMIDEKPGDFVKVVASLVPKEATLNINNADDLSDAELAERIAALAAQLSPFLPGGTGNPDEGAEVEAGAGKSARLH